jgi:LysM domain-containing protein
MRSIERPFDEEGDQEGEQAGEQECRRGTGPRRWRPEMTTMTMTAGAAPVRAGRRTPARLTRRGRVAVVLFVLLCLVIGAFAVGRVSSTAATSATRSHAHYVVVRPGESLWAIARRALPDSDPRVGVERIIDLNSLTDATVVPGQRLALPTG